MASTYQRHEHLGPLPAGLTRLQHPQLRIRRLQLLIDEEERYGLYYGQTVSVLSSDDTGGVSFKDYQAPPVVNANIANTRTYEVEQVSQHFSRRIGVEELIETLNRFNRDTAELRSKERAELYDTFYIPKNREAFVESMLQKQN